MNTELTKVTSLRGHKAPIHALRILINGFGKERTMQAVHCAFNPAGMGFGVAWSRNHGQSA